MSLYVDQTFVSRLSSRLDRFQKKSEYLWNFRCTVCGDSQKNKLKSRGYIYRRKDGLFFACHNCNASMSLGNFIKTIDQSLYREYLMEQYKENSPTAPKPDFSNVKTNAAMTSRFAITTSINLPTIKSLPEDHKAKLFLLNRKIPREFFDDLYYTVDFAEFIKELIPDHDKLLYKNEKRIVIPFRDENNILLGVQGRLLDNIGIRYISVKLKDTNRKIYGLNKVDFRKPIKVVEGPFDSMFLSNALAVMDSSLYNIISVLGDHDYTFIPDLEPRNIQIIAVAQKCISLDRKLCLLPHNLPGKDINEIILNGVSPIELESLVTKYTYQGLRAQLELNQWKKINCV